MSKIENLESWASLHPSDAQHAVELASMAKELIAYRADHSWRCFHCGDVFTDEDAAREHFGPTMDAEPICQVTAERYREVERQLEGYRNESDAMSKTFYDIGHRAGLAERDAEQKGYDRGIADCKAHPSEVGLQSPITQGDIDMAKHFAREAYDNVFCNLDGNHANSTAQSSLEAALAKMVECLKP